MKYARMQLTEQDLVNLITVIEWGLSDYDDKEHTKELMELLVNFEDKLESLRKRKD